MRSSPPALDGVLPLDEDDELVSPPSPVITSSPGLPCDPSMLVSPSEPLPVSVPASRSTVSGP